VKVEEVAGPTVALSMTEARNIARLLAGVASFHDHGQRLAVQALSRHLQR
jgi:hypothetical protein